MKPVLTIKVPSNMKRDLMQCIANGLRTIKGKLSEDYHVMVIPESSGVVLNSEGTVINVTIGKDLIKDFSELHDKLDELRELTKASNNLKDYGNPLNIEGVVGNDTPINKSPMD